MTELAETKECPFCAEDIKAAAILCRYCHSRLDGNVPIINQPPANVPIPSPTKPPEHQPPHQEAFHRFLANKTAESSDDTAVSASPAPLPLIQPVASASPAPLPIIQPVVSASPAPPPTIQPEPKKPDPPEKKYPGQYVGGRAGGYRPPQEQAKTSGEKAGAAIPERQPIQKKPEQARQEFIAPNPPAIPTIQGQKPSRLGQYALWYIQGFGVYFGKLINIGLSWLCYVAAGMAVLWVLSLFH